MHVVSEVLRLDVVAGIEGVVLMRAGTWKGGVGIQTDDPECLAYVRYRDELLSSSVDLGVLR